MAGLTVGAWQGDELMPLLSLWEAKYSDKFPKGFKRVEFCRLDVHSVAIEIAPKAKTK